MRPVRSLRRLTAVLMSGIGAVTLAFAVLAVAPVHLPPLPEAAPPAPPAETQVFGYATLANPLVRLWVLGRPAPSAPGVLEGWRREGRDLLPDAEGRVAGRVFAVSPRGMTRLDRYERAGLRYQRHRARLADGRDVWVYRLSPPMPPR